MHLPMPSVSIASLFLLIIGTPPFSVSLRQSTISSNSLKPRQINVIVVGGSSGMGKAAAIAVVRQGGIALLVSRSYDKLERAKKEIISYAPLSNTEANNRSGCCVQTAVLDVSDELAVEEFARSLEKNVWDALVFSAAGRAPHGPVTGSDLPTARTRELFETKFWGAWNCAKHVCPMLMDGGSVVFVAGVLNRRPGINCAPLACTNGALEGLTRSLALEVGPRLRVNCLSPGFCDTERFDYMDAERREAMLRNTAESLPLKRVGTPDDMGEAIHYLLTAPFCTGVVLDCDGGHGIRQYASSLTDPMRQTTIE